MNQELDELLGLLIENERQVGRYYRTMVDLIPEHKATWESLSSQEEDHAAALEEIRQAAKENPRLYAPGKYAPAAALMTIRETGEMIGKIERREVHPRYAVTFVTDIENSMLESQMEQAVKTDVAEVRNTLNRLREQTKGHRDLLRSITV
jgi:rubrerythrin